MTEPISRERLLELLHYDPETGVFRWRIKRARIEAGTIVGNENKTRPDQPYRQIWIKGKNYRASRLAWLYMTGALPEKEIDHRNGNPLDDAWSNLRLATSTQNKANQKRRPDNKTGFKGVHIKGERFYARTRIGGVYKYLGMFGTAEEAAAKYREITTLVHGEFARHE